MRRRAGPLPLRSRADCRSHLPAWCAASSTTRLTLAAGWWSSKQQVVDLSIITGLTVSRLDQLQAQCQAWRGSLVASVYLVLYMPPGHTDSLSDANRKAIEDAAAQMDTVHAA